MKLFKCIVVACFIFPSEGMNNVLIFYYPNSREKMAMRKTKIQSFYFDMNLLGNYWGCDEGPRKYVIMDNML